MTAPRALLAATAAAVVAVMVTAALAVAVGPADPDERSVPPTAVGSVRPTAPAAAGARADRPLAGRTVVLDPGHQLGNGRFPRRVNRLVPAGGFRKPCNTTGTASRGGYPEATVAWRVSALVARRLRALGARVVLTRTTNSVRRWGPCVDARGRAGNPAAGRRAADLKLSVHADGDTGRGARGFHVIVPPDRRPWTHDVWRPSRRFAVGLRAALRAGGLPVANYTAGRDGLDVRGDLGTLNLSDVPVAMVELGNLRDPVDARRLTRPAGQARYARALVRGVVRTLTS